MKPQRKNPETRNKTYHPKDRVYVGLTMPEDLHKQMVGKCQYNNIHVSAYIRGLVADDIKSSP